MPECRPRILLLSAYRADSHAAWVDWLTTTFDAWDWEVLELPGRHFRWRIRGNPLSWLERLESLRPDAIVASSMVDLATLRGLHPPLAAVPALYYFHENQFAYPTGEHQVRSVEPQMVQLYAALAADRVLFNSRFNRDSFLAGTEDLLQRMPDAVPPGIRQRLESRSGVLPIPQPALPDTPAAARDPRLIVWNHRWEYDKAPERFAEAMLQLAARGVEFRLALLGARPRHTPEPLQRLRADLGERIVADGKLPRAEYAAVLRRAAVVVSTTLHEFQGLAMLEATAAGATPLVPDALVYPEQYPAEYRYPPGDTAALVHRLEDWLDNRRPLPPPVGAWSEAALLPQWQGALEGLLPAPGRNCGARHADAAG